VDFVGQIGKCYLYNEHVTHYLKVLNDRIIHVNASVSLIQPIFFNDPRIEFRDKNEIVFKDFIGNGQLLEISKEKFNAVIIKSLYDIRFMEYIDAKKLIDSSRNEIKTIHDILK
jgi:hypothetical protein